MSRCSRTVKPGSLQTAPYWKPLEQSGSDNNRHQPRRTDVVIVGSGFTGLSASLTLARRDRSVVVFDKYDLGAGASTRNGGQIGSGNQKFKVKDLINLFGKTKATALLHEGVEMLDQVERFVQAENIDCHFKRCGRFRGAVRPEHYESMARDMDDLKRYAGVESFAIPKSDQHNEIGTDYFHGGSVLPQDAGLHPGLLHAGMMDCATEAGVELFGHTPVTSIEPVKSGYKVTAGGRMILARNVIVSTNGYTQHLDNYFDRRIVQVQSAVIATEIMPEDLINSLMPTGRMYGNTARVFFYFRRSPSEPRLLWGGRVGRLHRNGSPSAYSHLARDVLKVFPALSEVHVTHGWNGNIGYTFDDLPHLGKSPRGIHFAMGYCGTGVSRSMYFGKKIALQLLGDPHGKTEFDEIRFPSHTFSAFANAAVPVVERWYQFKDRFNL